MNLWWERKNLSYDQNNKIVFANYDVAATASMLKTPVFLYDAVRIKDNMKRITEALNNTGVTNRIFYAVKANRFAPLLTFLKTENLCGVDVCSPQEVRHALSCGFVPSDISFTGTSVSNEDLDFLLQFPDLIINCDSLSMLRRIGSRAEGRPVGIRINPALGTGYGSNELVRYSGDKPTKFGIYKSEFQEALSLANRHNLTINRIHFHTGCGYLNDQLSVWEKILTECLDFIAQIPTIKAVNLGGGLGVPLSKDDDVLNLSEWSKIVGKVFGGKKYEINVEPGTYVVKDAGVLVLEANTVEVKSGHRFIGVNGGFNLAMEPAHYKLPCEPVPCVLYDTKEKCFAADALSPATIAGNINEALDVWNENLMFPHVEEGELLCFVNAGAYTSSMSSNHCMRGEFSEYLLLGKS